MEKIIYYKLQSPYPEDETKNCKLTMTEIDSNFLTLKDNDISGATYDSESYAINIDKNNGEKINIDLSAIKNKFADIESQIQSGSTSGQTSVGDVNLRLNLSSDGVLSATWATDKGDRTTSVSGLLTSISSTYVDNDTIKGEGKKTDPFRLTELEKNNTYTGIISVVESLPTENLSNGDKYIIKKKTSDFGALFSYEGLKKISETLSNSNSVWRVPTKDDWDKLLAYCEGCEDDTYYKDTINIEQGKISGKVLKNKVNWTTKSNLNTYNFTINPACYSDSSKDLIIEAENAIFWTNTEYQDNTMYLKEFDDNITNVKQIASQDGYYYSIRLVMDYNGGSIPNKINLFGNSYSVIYIPEIEQLWLGSNLDESFLSEELNLHFEYEQSIIMEKYFIYYWNGTDWESNILKHGDEVNLNTDTNVIQYKIIENTNYNSYLIKTMEVTENKTIYDSGWY